jgi:7,8-dihydropterin-6-yl-methyl-4-(beta-D-ribofuranosyl)aminobenzene 5'-phosphate synthase
LNLREADRLEVTVLVDNYSDLLLLGRTGIARRPQVAPPDCLLAEHGLSCLLNVRAGSEERARMSPVKADWVA